MDDDLARDGSRNGRSHPCHRSYRVYRYASQQADTAQISISLALPIYNKPHAKPFKVLAWGLLDFKKQRI